MSRKEKSTPSGPMSGFLSMVQSKLGTCQKRQVGIVFLIGSATRRYGVWCRTAQTMYVAGSSRLLSFQIKTKKQSRLSSWAVWARACAESADGKGILPAYVRRQQRHPGSTRCHRRSDRFLLRRGKGVTVTSLVGARSSSAP